MKNHQSFAQLTHSKQLSWLDACQLLEQLGQSYVIATVVACVGSVPRETGSKMVISDAAQFDTIGGGNLEYQVIQAARKGLKAKSHALHIERFALSADLGQCCGGAVQIMFEYFQTQLPNVAIFGAGHVCHALSTILSRLPCHTKVIDNRADWINSIKEIRGITSQLVNDPTSLISTLPHQTYIVIMTQDHSLDFELARLCLEENRFQYIGMIGSEGKNQRFRYRLSEQLTNHNLLSQLTCPIGLANVNGKLPMQVAVSIAGQLISHWNITQVTAPNSDIQNNQTSEVDRAQWSQANQARKVIQATNTSEEYKA
jgi:xanthine dehydrogenase accessory factor